MSSHAGELTEAKGWKAHWHAPVLVLLLAGIGGVSYLVPWAVGPSGGFRSARLVAWLATLLLLLAFAIVAGHAATHSWRGILIGGQNKLSVSRLQVLLWTAVVVSSYQVSVLSNAALHAPHAPLGVQVPQALWFAMWVSVGSFALAPVASVLNDDKKQRIAENANDDATQAGWVDLVADETAVNKIDIGKVQMLLVTISLLVVYGIVLGQKLDTGPPTIASLPKVNDAFAIFLAISHGGYLAKKGAPPAPPKS